LPAPLKDLARDQERDQLLGQVVEVDVAVDQVVLVAAVAVATKSVLFLKIRELPGDALLADLLLRRAAGLPGCARRPGRR